MRRLKSPLMIVSVFAVLLHLGCTTHKTDRGYLIRHESAWEVNRTPWIGCPPDANCGGEDEEKCGFFDCLKKDSGGEKCGPGKKFRRHCGVSPDCTAKNPCCKTLGCGMWTDPNEPMATNSPARACGLTPFCSPMKPCGLTPHCGKPNPMGNMNAMTAMGGNTLMLGNSGMGGMMGAPFIPNTMYANGTVGSAMIPQPTLAAPGAPERSPSKSPSKTPTVAGPNGMRVGAVPNPAMNKLLPNSPNSPIPGSAGGSLISMGIVPGVSTITTGGLVAAAGVATPAGMMTPSGVLLPNGSLQSQGVIRVCAMHPNCTAARPCGMTAGCGMIVPVAMVSNNAVMLASALSAPGIAGNVMQAGGTYPAYGAVPGYVNGTMMSAGGIPTDRMGTGMLVNPITGQPVAGLSMNGRTQMGYPPIGYAPTGYSPGFPRPTMQDQGVEEEEEETPAAETAPTPPQSQMPVPRFHPVPSKPTFQRSEGLPTAPSKKRTVSATGRVLTKESLNAAMEQAYLEGIADAMEDVHEEIESQNQELAKAELQAKILRQAQEVQVQLDTRQEAKRKLQDETAVLQAQYQQTQLQQAQLQQVALQQAQLQQTKLQSAQFQQFQTDPRNPQGTGKGFFASASGFLSSTPPPNTVRMLNAPPQQQGLDAGLLGSAKAAGSDLASMVSETVSPLTGLLGFGQQKAQPMPMRPYPMQAQQIAAVQYVPKNPTPVQVVRAEPIFAAPVRPKVQKKNNYPCPPCPPFAMNPSAPVGRPDDAVAAVDEDVPMRPPTAQRPKKVIDADDKEPMMIQSANFVERR